MFRVFMPHKTEPSPNPLPAYRKRAGTETSDRGTAMKKYGILGAIVRAPFFSGDLYRDVGRNWNGIGLLMILLVLIVCWTLAGIKAHHGLGKFARDEFPKVVEDFP